ncbi:hypothetical protein EMIHUDRAFT_225064 [Emiliania huxleyi CCMP1516]|uniref:Glycosyltransferase 61 catalytic domain-containing protein n=2 Tax=Emiliania huxleyi TaxID=2903 RepID=A0A0D3KPX2_EMIH1|nr:hypothetical protein EMIHUDRAFT_225064 [Emiliania huxleyi CCMP1516]EOD37807.1 hypothetical protein EMIHUDRAFT_225064 [Emiliania huxleyi CCMP1516]|eukprot:XP_005790236.1 hypothetical protein EMIHUDRAFT_225064 [Emiliania huxleyi CCMP1516]
MQATPLHCCDRNTLRLCAALVVLCLLLAHTLTGSDSTSTSAADAAVMLSATAPTIGAVEHRGCVFEKVCYLPNESDFVFYSRPGNVSELSLPAVYDHRQGAQHTFRWRKSRGDGRNADFVALNKDVPYKRQLTWSARTQPGPVPAGAVWARGVSALSAPFAPTNLGHVAWDEAFPLLAAMAQLGVYSPSLRVLRTHSCATLAKRASSSAVCRKFAAAFLGPLTDARAAASALQEPPTLEAEARALAGGGGGRPVCFDKLLVGGTFDSFNREELNVGKEPLIALYRARVLAAHGISPTAPPSSHTIIIVAKKGRRAIANVRRVAAAVRAEFGSVAEIVLTDWAGMSMAEQLRLVASTTVAVSPCGGISMLLPFLPQGAAAVLVNYMLGEGEEARHGECDPAAGGCSWTMEAELWRHVRHVTKVYYQAQSPIIPRSFVRRYGDGGNQRKIFVQAENHSMDHGRWSSGLVADRAYDVLGAES